MTACPSAGLCPRRLRHMHPGATYQRPPDNVKRAEHLPIRIASCADGGSGVGRPHVLPPSIARDGYVTCILLKKSQQGRVGKNV
ncbi:hypothetical protein M378DRAFT_157333 [Amanita muscaria Koide BX008]|uniref:Uncharacterized protein n=1 Tax=Amanita muscaria (strain Koide BX008) TaxID=946122 RepID=A0A0C2XJ95_AMAMK|nr:hypothetical protein M378DRAFT_157333 [Amanita muscaria Koide BX008]